MAYVGAYRTMATDGIIGALTQGEWTGPGFSDNWRVNKTSSLFDYGRDVTPDKFVSEPFPQDKAPPMDPRNVGLAKQVCTRIKGEKLEAISK